MERYDLYIDEHRSARALCRSEALNTAHKLIEGLAVRARGQTEICIRVSQTDELRAVWFWTSEGWQQHAAAGWT